MKYFFLVVFAGLLWFQSGAAQLNAYRYVVVPKTLQDFEQENQYHSSTLLKYLLNQENFTAYYEGDVPPDAGDNCLGLTINLLDESTMLRTKVFLNLKDCQGREVFRTMEGSSRIKDVKDAYEDAIRNAFKSIEALNYHFEPGKTAITSTVVVSKEPVKNKTPETMESVSAEIADSPAVVSKATPEEQLYEDKRPTPSPYSVAAPATVVAAGTTSVAREVTDQADEDILYAQELQGGYQLVDRKPSIRFVLQKTSLTDVYLAENDGNHGLVYKKDNQWYFEYYRDGQPVLEILQIRF